MDPPGHHKSWSSDSRAVPTIAFDSSSHLGQPSPTYQLDEFTSGTPLEAHESERGDRHTSYAGARSSFASSRTSTVKASPRPSASPSWHLSASNAIRHEYGNESPDLHQSHSFSSTTSFQPFLTDTDREPLKTPSMKSNRVYPPSHYTLATEKKAARRTACWSLTVLFLSIYSTVLSAVWLLIALIKPRYGINLGFVGGISPNMASTLIAGIAKTIELSFVSVFVVFTGQVLSRRTLMDPISGFKVPELSIRSFMLQPGLMIIQWRCLGGSLKTFLGIVTLIAAIAQILYTTASDALVTPKPKLGATQYRSLSGAVRSSFANEFLIRQECQNPITAVLDPQHSSETCADVEHAGQAQHNYLQYMANWTQHGAPAERSTDLESRPAPVAILFDNTTVQGSWIYPQNMTQISETYGGRIINNVSMAFPHASVSTAARDEMNGIMQPQYLTGVGTYFLEASVVSPTMHTLCARASEEELTPLIYAKWPGIHIDQNFTFQNWPQAYNLSTFDDLNRSTVMDDIFEMGTKYQRQPPVFPKYPRAQNTLVYTEAIFGDPFDTIYLLAGTPSDLENGTQNYTLCSMYVTLDPQCSTTFHASWSGASIGTNCAPGNQLAYSVKYPQAPTNVRVPSWTAVSTDWALAIALNGGLVDADAALPRQITQFMPTSPSLQSNMPSMAEALAVLGGCTLLLSSEGTTFQHEWNFDTVTAPNGILRRPVREAFDASLSYQDYASGGTRTAEQVFILVLLIVCLLNVLCLVYFVRHGGLITDFTEPPILFDLTREPPRLEEGKLRGRIMTGDSMRWSYRNLFDKGS